MSKIIVAKAMATRKCAYCQEPSKIILLLTAQRICALSSSIGKNTCCSFAKLSAWCAQGALILH